MKRIGAALLMLVLGSSLLAEPKLALVGPLADEKSLDRMVAQEAVDAFNNSTSALKLKLAVFNGGNDEATSLEAVKKAVEDDEVLAVVLHGEAAASPAVLAELAQAGLASIAASSWAQTRTAQAVTWLSPSQIDLASNAAVYAGKEAKAKQVAVLDNGSPTSTAAARTFAAKFRALGGKVAYEGSFAGTPESLAAELKALGTHWPQMVFYAGEAAAAGALVEAMKEEKALKNADLIALPSVFEPAFFDTARLKSMRTRGIFPCPDFGGQTPLLRLTGLAFAKTSPEYKAYFRAYRRPGRWTSMLFDGVALAARAVGQAVNTEVAGEIKAPSRAMVAETLKGIESYRGIRGLVKFGPNREPADPRAMVYFALNRVNKKEMQWREKAYGPPY